jgi:bifunctional DNA-binding transcriptional regulator/antitoxin component of YhaV-PrlF toxin-antitoxin module
MVLSLLRNKEDKNMIISESKLTSKRQITLPIKILRYIGLTPGDRVIFQERNGHIELAASSKFSIDDLSAKYRNVSSKKATDEEINKARQEAWSQRGQAK